MPDDLRTKLAKSKIEGQGTTTNTSPWPESVWAAARAAYKSGWRMPEKRYPVIISPDSPISSPEKLQQLVNLPLLPKVTTTTKTTMFDTDEDRAKEEQIQIQICDLDWPELVKLKEHTEGEKVYIRFQDSRRLAWLVRSVRKTPVRLVY